MKSPLKWSKKKPSQTGWYMFRSGPKNAAIPTRVWTETGELVCQVWADIGWFRLVGLKGEWAFIAR